MAARPARRTARAAPTRPARAARAPPATASRPDAAHVQARDRLEVEQEVARRNWKASPCRRFSDAVVVPPGTRPGCIGRPRPRRGVGRLLPCRIRGSAVSTRARRWRRAGPRHLVDGSSPAAKMSERLVDGLARTLLRGHASPTVPDHRARARPPRERGQGRPGRSSPPPRRPGPALQRPKSRILTGAVAGPNRGSRAFRFAVQSTSVSCGRRPGRPRDLTSA